MDQSLNYSRSCPVGAGAVMPIIWICVGQPDGISTDQAHAHIENGGKARTNSGAGRALRTFFLVLKLHSGQ